MAAENKLIGKKYQGKFSIELYGNVSLAFLKQGGVPFEKQGNTIVISDGTAYQSMGGIQLSSQGKEFYFRYEDMRRITGSQKETLWENRNYAK